MPCMCGDVHCASCGPSQGNWRCPICRAWADDGCEHVDDDGGTIREEFRETVEAMVKTEMEATEKWFKEMEESERLASEYWKSRRKELD